MNADVSWDGFEDLVANLQARPEQIVKAAGGGLYRAAERIMADSKEHYVPVDQGILRDSGHVELPEYVDGGVQVRLGFGGAAEAYADIQHEDMTLNHPNGGGPKYLERPLLEHAKTLLADIRDDVAAALGGGQ